MKKIAGVLLDGYAPSTRNNLCGYNKRFKGRIMQEDGKSRCISSKKIQKPWRKDNKETKINMNKEDERKIKKKMFLLE